MEIQVLENRTILNKQFNIYGTIENPLFLAKDVAEWIEHSNPTEMLKFIDESEKLNSTILRAGQNREMTFLTEDGLYEVLMLSRKPIAKEFKRQVKEILKSIRKHGAYLTPQKIEEVILNPDLIIGLATKLKEEQKINQYLQTQNQAQAQELQKQAPKVLFADAVSTSKTSILVGEMAKILKQNGIEIGQNRFFEWLRSNGYLITRGGSDFNMPTQKSMDLGLFEIKETTITHSDGHISVNKTPKITGKGQLYFVNKFLKKVA